MQTTDTKSQLGLNTGQNPIEPHQGTIMYGMSRLSRVRYPRATPLALVMTFGVFFAFGVWASAHNSYEDGYTGAQDSPSHSLACAQSIIQLTIKPCSRR